MSINLDLTSLQVLADPLIKQIFKLIVSSRTLPRYEIQAKESLPKEELDIALLKLESAGLIEKSSSSLQEFDQFFPTGSGLSIEKLVK
jgi:hypothetical protein